MSSCKGPEREVSLAPLRDRKRDRRVASAGDGSERGRVMLECAERPRHLDFILGKMEIS